MKAHLRYLWYLLRHKWFVLQAGLKTGVSSWRLLIHDWSKFLPIEWFAYARYFYGNKELYRWADEHGRYIGYSGRGLLQLQQEFDRAWLHHQHRNPHHWQHWVLREDSGNVKILEMPEHFAREMVADWAGAGRTITGRWEIGVWYLKNKERLLLHPRTRTLVEVLLQEWP